MMKLLLHPPILAHESLRSYMERLVQANKYSSSVMITTLLGDQIEPESAEWFQALASLTAQDAVELYLASFHSLADAISPPGTNLEQITLSGERRNLLPPGVRRKHLRPMGQVAYCPDCIGEEPYHRLHWQPKLSLMCLSHLRVLQYHCDHCNAPVTMSTLVADRCSQCGRALSEVVVKVNLDRESSEYMAQSSLQSWFGISKEFRSLQDPRLLNLPSRLLYTLVIDLFRLVKRLGPEVPSFQYTIPRTALPEGSHESTRENLADLHRLTIALNVLSDWPDSFYNFLDQIRLRDGRRRRDSLSSDFPYLYVRLLEDNWKHPAYATVQEAFDEYLAKHYQKRNVVERTRRYQENESVQQRRRLVSKADAARILEVGLPEVDDLLARDLLWREPRDIGRVWIDRAHVQVIREEFQRSYSLDAAAERLETTSEVISRLLEKGWLQAEVGPDGLETESLRITGSSFLRLLNGLHRSAKTIKGELLTLEEAVDKLRPLAYDIADIVEMALTGELRSCYTITMGKMRVSGNDVNNLLARAFEKVAPAFYAAAARARGVSPTLLRSWHRRGLIDVEPGSNWEPVVTDEAWARFIDTHPYYRPKPDGGN